MSWTLFERVPADRVDAILAATVPRSFGRGDIVVHEGDPADALHLIETGHVMVRSGAPMSDMAFRVLGPGQYFGELALVSAAPRTTSVVALDDTTTRDLSRADFDRLRRADPGIEETLFAAVIEEIRRLTLALAQARYASLPARLADALCELAAIYDSDGRGRISIPVTQEQLAELCGSNRHSVQHLLARMAGRGLVEVGRGRIAVLDLPALHRLQNH